MTPTDKNELSVEASDDLGGDPDHMTEAVEELHEQLDVFDPEDIAAVGTVIQLKGEREGPDGEGHTGFQFRALSDSLEGFDGPRDVVWAVASFNDSLGEIAVPTDLPSSQGGDLQGLLGAIVER